MRLLQKGARRLLVHVALTAGLTAAPVAAQVVGGNLAGRVTDESGAALPGATVTVTNKANGAQQTLVTTAEGTYRIVALQPATYQVKTELTGFGSTVREIVITIGANAT